MIDKITTLEQARKYRYGEWAGNPRGNRYQEGRCAYEVHDTQTWLMYQCRRKNGYGAGGLYCKQHAKSVPAEG